MIYTKEMLTNVFKILGEVLIFHLEHVSSLYRRAMAFSCLQTIGIMDKNRAIMAFWAFLSAPLDRKVLWLPKCESSHFPNLA